MVKRGRVVGRKLASLAVCALYFASGATGLVYEVVFSKYLSYAFGATAYASSAVLVAFMGGLSLGALLVARWDGRIKNRLLVYGAVEALVGVLCLASPALFSAIGGAYVALARALPASRAMLTALRCLFATTIVFLPAAGMGATFPLLAPIVAGRERGRWLSALYALNILGGATGSLVGAYALVPALGLSGTLRAAAVVNIAIGAAAV